MRPPSAATKPVPIAPPASIWTTEGRSFASGVRELLIARRDHRGPLVRAARTTRLDGRRQQRHELAAGGQRPGADEEDGADQDGRADDEAGVWAASSGGQRASGMRQPRPAAVASGAAAGHTSGGVGGRSRQLRCWRSSPAKGSSTGAGLRIGTFECRSDPTRSGQ